MIPLNLLLPQFFVWRKLGTKSGVSYTGVWISSLQIIFFCCTTHCDKKNKKSKKCVNVVEFFVVFGCSFH